MKQIIIPADIGSMPYLDTVSLYHDDFGWVIHPMKTATCGGKQPTDGMALGTAGLIGKTINISGRLFFTARQIKDFEKKALRGDFAVSIQPPPRKAVPPKQKEIEC
jgi:hypothetical protein